MPPRRSGAGNKTIEDEADFALQLPAYDGWLTWSLLLALIQDGRVEVVPGTERRRRYRLAPADATPGATTT